MSHSIEEMRQEYTKINTKDNTSQFFSDKNQKFNSFMETIFKHQKFSYINSLMNNNKLIYNFEIIEDQIIEE